MSIDANKLRELIEQFEARTNDGTCCFCGADYTTSSSRGDFEDVGFCWTCGTEKLIEVLPMLPAIADLADEVAEQAARIDAAKKRMRDCKAIHSRWFDGHDPRDKADILNEMEGVLYSAMLYLGGEEGPYRPDLAARTALAKPANGGGE